MAVLMDESWADQPTNFTLTDGDLTVTIDVAPWRGIIATEGYASGKIYWEVTIGNQANILSSYSQSVGICLTGHTKTSFMGSLNGLGYAGHPVLLNNEGTIFRQGTQDDPIGPFDTYIETDILGLALDMDNNKLFLHINGVYQNGGDPVAGTDPIYDSIPAGTWYPSVSLIAVNSAVTFNFGATAFSYSPPAGFQGPDQTFFTVDKAVLGPGSAAEVMALVNTQLATIASDKTIHKLQLIQDSRNKDEVVAVLITET